MRMPPIVLLTALIVSGAAAQDSQPPRPGDWPAYSHDQMGQRYSPLAQINSANVSRLRRVWTYGVATGPVDPNPANRLESTTEAVPIVVNGVLYSPTVQHSIVALEPETGEELWKFDLGRASGTLRGVTYWAGDANTSARLLARTSEGALIALDAKNGEPIPSFGNNGRVDLRPGVADKFPNAPYHISTPGVIYKNLIITGAQGKEDDPDGPAMDAGGYVAALEYAADVRAEVIGKPSAQIYRAALAACGADPGSATMVGDDLVSDLRPAAALGMATCLVRTGKGGSFDPAPGEIDLDVPDLAAFVDLLLS